MTEHEHPIGPGLAKPWLIANVTAFTIGGGLAGGVLRSLEQPYYDSGVSAFSAAIIQAVSVGASMAVWATIAAVAQWLVLRRAFDARWWIPATVVGWTVSGTMTGFLAGGSVSQIGPAQGPVPQIVALLVGYPLLAACLLVPQWLVLRRVFTGAGPWWAATIAGMLFGFGLGLMIAMVVARLGFLGLTDFPSAKVFVIVGAVGGPIYAGLTWVVLRELRRR